MSEKKRSDIIKEAEEVAEIGERKSQVEELATELNKVAPPGESITREQVEAVQRSIERVAKRRKSSKGKYKVIGVDKFDGGDWVEGEYDTPEEALRVAREKTSEAKRFATDSSIATVYYAYDPDGRYLGGDTWKAGEKGGLA